MKDSALLTIGVLGLGLVLFVSSGRPYAKYTPSTVTTDADQVYTLELGNFKPGEGVAPTINGTEFMQSITIDENGKFRQEGADGASLLFLRAWLGNPETFEFEFNGNMGSKATTTLYFA